MAKNVENKAGSENEGIFLIRGGKRISFPSLQALETDIMRARFQPRFQGGLRNVTSLHEFGQPEVDWLRNGGWKLTKQEVEARRSELHAKNPQNQPPFRDSK